MDNNMNTRTPEEFLQILSVLDEGGVVPLVVSGSSMAPFLIHGRDTVYLSKITQPVKRGDIVLYRSKNGALVLHRVYRVEENGYSMVGDAQDHLESGVTSSQLLAVAKGVLRKEKLLGPNNCQWKFFEKFWLFLLPWRKMLIAGYAGLSKKRR